MASDLPPPVLPRRTKKPDRPPSIPISSSSPPLPSPSPHQSSAPVLNENDAFGYCLQSSYEAIGKRHEEEMHALESMRMHIFKRMKCDKDYADQLLRANQSCSRHGQFTSSTTSAAVQVSSSLVHVHAYNSLLYHFLSVFKFPPKLT